MNQMTQDLKETLNLPKTSFSMKANLSQREPNFVKFWKEENIYEKMIHDPSRTETYVLNDGPPYANGPIHIGHSVNKILKDFIIKSQSFFGKKAPYIPGWDCHGLPIEVQIEKKFGRGKLSPKDFREKCRQYAQSQIQIQCEGFERLGVLGRWDNPYKTMQPSFEARIVKQFLSMVDKGTVTHGLRPVHWCPHCLSALSDAETEFAQKQSNAIDVAFKVAEKASFFNSKYTTYLVIWTTTPWTIPANQAIAYSEEISYLALKHEQRVYLIAENLKERCLKAWGLQEDKIEVEAVSLEQIQALKHAHHPLYQRLVPVLPGTHVTDESGTGFVHIAPDHGPEDFLLGKENKLSPLNLLDDAGRFREHVDAYAGLKNFQAEQTIIDDLKEQGALLHHELYEHSYPVCWRHKKPIFFRTTPQWFVSLQDHFKEQLVSQVEKVQWHPSWGAERMKKMIENRPDWCISRQRHWGTPLTLIYDKQTFEIHPQMQEIGEKVVQEIQEKGIEAWFHSDLQHWGVDNKDERWAQSFDTLDVWFDSGSVFHLLEDEKLQDKADLYLEGNDQYRGWFQSSLINSVAYQGQAPYKAVLTHGMVVDSHGKKMSKSLGNVIAPSQVAQKYGIDILRLWVAMSDYREELAIGDVILARTADVYRRLRNTLRFILGNLHDFEESDLIQASECSLIDRYTLTRLAQIDQKCKQAYQEYRFDLVARTIIDFSVNDLGANYLDIIKDRLYTSHKNSQARRSAQSVLYHLYHSLVRLLAPVLSFTAEDAWQHCSSKKSESIFLERFLPSDQFLNLLTPEQEEHAQVLLKVKKDLQSDMESLRQEGKIGSALEVHLKLQVPQGHIFKEMTSELAFIFLVSQVTVLEDASASDISWQLESLSDHDKCERCWFRVPLNEKGICQRCDENISQPSERRVYG